VTQQFIIHLGRETILSAMMVAGPILGLALIIGLSIGIFQAVTSINEMTLTFIPKIVVVLGSVVILSPWMLRVILGFTTEIFNSISLVAH
jgi:flagellar biosynthesis protein FliQ